MVRVFCDFDGTIATEDVGNKFFRTFAGERAVHIVQRYLNGEINARECLELECAALTSFTPNITSEQLVAFFDQFEIDPQFPAFVDFCTANEIPVTIVSDGLDLYVQRILENHRLGHLRWFANHVEIVARDGVTSVLPSFPYRDAECDRCGNCKRNHLVTLSGDDDIIVYVGDGISDHCPVRYADIVFAKGSLLVYCQEQNITYHAFRHFGDVQARLENILQQRRLRKRREAEVARRDLFKQG
jgi:2-hydroxy-3-keto-5-methylthiopentenyl-1-phosphate phosphatase